MQYRHAVLLLTLSLFTGLSYSEQQGNCTAGEQYCEQNSLTTTIIQLQITLILIQILIQTLIQILIQTQILIQIQIRM